MDVHRLNEDARESADRAVLTRFLLGELPDQERERLEDACFEDEALFARLLRAEDDLIDAYVRGDLTAGERERFEQRFGRTPAQARRVRFARLLQRAVEERKAGGHVRRRPVVLAAAAAVLLATVLGVGWWMIRQGRSPQVATAPPRPTTTIAAPGPGPSPSSVPSPGPVQESPRLAVVVASLTLQPGTVRGAGATPKLVLSPSTDAVHLRLELGPGLAADAYSAYHVVVQTAAGAEVWRDGELRTGGPVARPFIGVRLPARTLTSGDYVVLLSGQNADGTEDYLRGYAFRVAR